MTTQPQVAERIQARVRARNRELLLDAAITGSLGVLFTLLTFGFLFWATFLLLVFVNPFSAPRWLIALLVMLTFLVVSAISAWRCVDPLAGLRPMTEREMFLTIASMTSNHLLFFSPRHTVAGSAALLIGGPANLFEAFGLWAHRIRAKFSDCVAAADLLERCRVPTIVDEVRDATAAVLLYRLTLIKAATSETNVRMVLTQKGIDVLDAAD